MSTLQINLASKDQRPTDHVNVGIRPHFETILFLIFFRYCTRNELLSFGIRIRTVI